MERVKTTKINIKRRKRKKKAQKTIRVTPTISESADRVFKESNIKYRKRLEYDAIEIASDNKHLALEQDLLQDQRKSYEQIIKHFAYKITEIDKRLAEIEQVKNLYCMPNTVALDNALRDATIKLREVQEQLDTPGVFDVKKVTLDDMYRIADAYKVPIQSLMKKLDKDLMKNTFAEYEKFR